MPPDQRRRSEQAEEIAEEGDFEGVQGLRGEPDHDRHASEEHRAGQHQACRAQMGAVGVHPAKEAPMMRGSGSSATPKFSRTDAATRRASASS